MSVVDDVLASESGVAPESGGDVLVWDDFQVAAMASIDAGRSVLVSAPTGAGKTAIAEHAVRQALADGCRAVYTTPIKALSNQKHRDFSAVHGNGNVGLLTGDTSVASDAPLVVMTTEVLRNMLCSDTSADRLADVAWVVLDEVHYLQDAERGAVWEEIIIHAPAHMRFVCLSATVSNAEQFGAWLRERRGDNVDVVVSDTRPVPLRHWHAVRDEKSSRLRRVPMLTADGKPNMAQGGFLDTEPRRFGESWDDYDYDEDEDDDFDDGYGYGGQWRFSTPGILEIVRRLHADRLLPTLFFIFSRARCDDAAEQLLRSRRLSLTTDAERDRIAQIVAERLEALPEQDRQALETEQWTEALQAGVAAHHAGILPVFKEIVEYCFDEGLVKVVFATETMALGVNMPARSVVIDKLTKWNGYGHEFLTAMQYAQISGRAGRRGIDIEGHVVSLWSPYVSFGDASRLAASREFPLRSSFDPTYDMAVRLAARCDRHEADTLISSSFAEFQTRDVLRPIQERIGRFETEADEARTAAVSPFGSIAEYEQMLAEDESEQERVKHGRQGVPNVGDVVRIDSGPPLAVMKRTTAKHGRRFWVLDATNRLRQLDPPHTHRRIEVCGAIPGIPKDLTRSTMPGRDNEHIISRLVSEQWRPISETESETRRRLHTHPVHADPDVADRLAELAEERELRTAIRELRREADSKACRLPDTFGAVVGVLETFGYLSGWELTDKGHLLAGIRHDNDLLIAEAVHSGLLDGHSDADLASVVAVAVHEARNHDDFHYFGDPEDDYDERDVDRSHAELAAVNVLRLSGRIKAAESDAGLHITKPTDDRYALAAAAWASGCTLAEALNTVPAWEPPIPAGDFARAMLMLADVLRQIAQAAPDPKLRRQCAHVASLLLRGAVTVGAPQATQP